MANEYQGASYGTIYQPSSNAVDNLLQVAERQKQDKINEDRYKARLDEEQKKQQGAIERYAGTLMGNKKYNIDPKNPYSAILTKKLYDATQRVRDAVHEGGYTEGMVQGIADSELLPLKQDTDKYAAVEAKIARDAQLASKAFGIDPKMALTLVTSTAFYNRDEKGNLNLKDLADLDIEADYAEQTFTGENAKYLPDMKLFEKDKLKDEDFTFDTKNEKGEFVSKRTKVTYNQDLNEIVEDENGKMVVIPKGSLPLVDREKEVLEIDLGENEIDPKTGNPKLGANGKPIKKKIPLRVFTPESYRQLVMREPKLELQMTKELHQENENLKKQGLPILEDDMADLFKRTYATTKIPQGSVIDGGEKNLTQRADLATSQSYKRMQFAQKMGAYNRSTPLSQIDKAVIGEATQIRNENDKIVKDWLDANSNRPPVGMDEATWNKKKQAAINYRNKSTKAKIEDVVYGGGAIEGFDDEAPTTTKPLTKAQEFLNRKK